MEFDYLDSRPGKSWNFYPSHGKSWNFMLANTYAVITAAYSSGLSEMYAGKHKPNLGIFFSCDKSIRLRI